MPDPEKTSSGFDENVAGALCYSLGWISGLVFYLVEPRNTFVRFHALQAVMFFGVACVAFVICLTIPFLGWILSIVVFYASLAVWLLMMLKAYQGQRFRLPIVGRMAEERL